VRGPLTLNAIAGMGMLGVGIIGAQCLGTVRDHQRIALLESRDPALVEQVAAAGVMMR